ncbi:MAG TPA: DUF2586 family protein [Candidatus Desulfovibrio intestinavium]|uniref:DUF2586 family protein n=1 Tax=Candidatus Desulfovibrio intestinavium TaxID=2838534 RepID=A0A9D2HPR4_9BACT|nr:DUF2586 family protein [Candidatus Desulfovibrio intestinavium]
MGDVLEYLVDGTSGLAPGGVEGSAIVAGVCSKGQVGKGYLLGKSSDLTGLLGVGPLVERARDMLATGGQAPTLIAVPCSGEARGHFTAVVATGGNGTYPDVTVSGVPQKNCDIVVKVESAGQIGMATVKISQDGGEKFGSALTAEQQLVIEGSGATLLFPEDAQLEAGWQWAFTARLPIGPVSRVGDEASPLPTVAGTVLAGADISIQIVKGGGRNEGTYQLSTDGGENYGKTRTIPVDGAVPLADLGVTVTFPEGAYVGGTTYACNLLAPEASIVDVMAALEGPLALYDIEFVLVAGPTDSVDWAAMQAKAEELWNLHRPTYFKAETRLPYDNEDLNDFTAWLSAEKQDIAARFVQVCPQYGRITGSDGVTGRRNAAGLQAGRSMSIPVQRATGRVRDGNISQLSLPDGWEAVQPVLEEAGFLTAKKYAGLDGAYWGDSRTLADDTSDYRYEEVIRTVFKAVRKARVAALKSMYDEAGDPAQGASKATGLAFLKSGIEAALDTMKGANPQELADYVVNIPDGQDIVNNGVVVEITLIGIPIIREIKLYFSYIYAGSRLDPRGLSQAA